MNGALHREERQGDKAATIDDVSLPLRSATRCSGAEQKVCTERVSAAVTTTRGGDHRCVAGEHLCALHGPPAAARWSAMVSAIVVLRGNAAENVRQGTTVARVETGRCDNSTSGKGERSPRQVCRWAPADTPRRSPASLRARRQRRHQRALHPQHQAEPVRRAGRMRHGSGRNGSYRCHRVGGGDVATEGRPSRCTDVVCPGSNKGSGAAATAGHGARCSGIVATAGARWASGPMKPGRSRDRNTGGTTVVVAESAVAALLYCRGGGEKRAAASTLQLLSLHEAKAGRRYGEGRQVLVGTSGGPGTCQSDTLSYDLTV